MSALGKIIKVIAGKLSTTPKQMKAGGHSGRTASEIVRSKKNESKRTGDKFRREGAAGYFRAKSKQEQAGGTSKRTGRLNRRQNDRDRRKNVEDGGNQ